MDIKQLEVGTFYLIHDGSNTGHPGFLVWKDDEANLYLFIKFGSTPNESNIPFAHSLNKNISRNYVYKRPFLAKRKNIGKKWVCDYKITENDKNVFLSLLGNNPVYSKNINRKDKRFYSLVVKHGKIKTAL